MKFFSLVIFLFLSCFQALAHPIPEDYLNPKAEICQRKPGDSVGFHITENDLKTCGEFLVIDGEFLEYHGLKEKYPELTKPMKLFVFVNMEGKLKARGIRGEPVYQHFADFVEKIIEQGYVKTTPYMAAVRKSMGLYKADIFYTSNPDFAQNLCLAAEEQRIYCWPYHEVEGPAIMSPRYSGFRNKYVPQKEAPERQPTVAETIEALTGRTKEDINRPLE